MKGKLIYEVENISIREAYEIASNLINSKVDEK